MAAARFGMTLIGWIPLNEVVVGWLGDGEGEREKKPDSACCRDAFTCPSPLLAREMI